MATRERRRGGPSARADERRFARPVGDPGDPRLDPTPAAQPAARAGGWRETVAAASGLNVLAGIWLIIAPFVLGYSGGDPYWNDIVFGAIVGVFGLARVLGAYRASWLSWLNALIGVWLFVSAFWLDSTSNAGVNDVILGIVVFVLGIASATATDEALATTPAARPPADGPPPRW
jgi:hypothetical protein